MKLSFAIATCLSLLFTSGCNFGETAKISNSHAASANNFLPLSGIDQSNIDHSVKPQDNFYLYANGGWLNRNDIPADKTAIGSFYELHDQVTDNIKSIIEELAATKNLQPGSDEQKVAHFFRSYMDTKTRNELGISPIQYILTAINNIKDKQQLASFFGQYQSAGISTPLGFYISKDAKQSDQYAAHIWQSGLGLPDREYYFNENQRFKTIRASYVNFIEKTYNLAGITNGKKRAQDILSLETQLAKYHWTRVETRNSEKRYNKYTQSQLAHLTPNFNWPNYLTAMGIGEQTAIIINQPSYLKGFGEVFAKTPLSIWKAYLTFNTLSEYASALTTEFSEASFNFYGKQLSGRNEQRAPWKRGVEVVNSNLGEIVGKIYVSRHFTPTAKAQMKILVEHLRSSFSQAINGLTWMSTNTKEAAQRKLAAFTAKIGYPDQWKDYSALTIKADDLVGNLIRSEQFAYQNAVNKLGGPIRQWEWHMLPQTVNGYYEPTANEVVFPAAILQPPFFNKNADSAVNYGAIGAVIGHEMAHGFDDQGSHYDENGNLHNWWTESDLNEFRKRTQLLVTQFNNYKILEDLSLNGKLTLGENISDLTGVTMAYRAYKASLNGKPSPIIDGLTGEQRFFIGYAQIWRAKAIEQLIRNRVTTAMHAPEEFRVLGTLANMPEFYQAFNVKEGDGMYTAPEKRTKIW